MSPFELSDFEIEYLLSVELGIGLNERSKSIDIHVEDFKIHNDFHRIVDSSTFEQYFDFSHVIDDELGPHDLFVGQEAESLIRGDKLTNYNSETNKGALMLVATMIKARMNLWIWHS